MRLRFRSNQRNEAVDMARIVAVKTAASTALTSIRSESVGLRERMDDLRLSLATALEDADELCFDRELEAEKELVFLEQQLLEAEKRSAALDKQLRILTQVDSLLRDVSSRAGEP
jgi:Tfp pilus assembly protein PilO